MHRVLLLVGVTAALTAGAPSAATPAKPSLTLAGRQPIALRGASFAPGERVQVTVWAGVRLVRLTHATSRGSFLVRFAGVNLPRCGGVFARARGGSGGVAALKIPLPACLPA